MTEKVRRYMDFMGTTKPRASSGGDPLATRPASRSKTTFVSKKTTASTTARVKSAAKRTTTPAPRPRAEDDYAIKAAAALSGSNLKTRVNDAPDGNKYALSGKSPFLTSYNIEKRPLSSSVKAQKVEEIPKKNRYEKQEKITEKKVKKDPVTIIDKPKKSGGFGLFLIILLTIILGAAVGAGAYFLLPKF